MSHGITGYFASERLEPCAGKLACTVLRGADSSNAVSLLDFAFVGRQVHLELGDRDFYPDLLFYHLKLRRYVVIELKARVFEPGDGIQLGMYMRAVDELLKHPDDKPSLGLLLVKEKNRLLVEYALGDLKRPISVAQWETELTQSLPDSLKGSLPSIEEIEAELSSDFDGLVDWGAV